MKKNPKTIAAIYDFMGYLSTRDSEIKIGSHTHPEIIINHLKNWTDNRNLDLDDPDISYWIMHWNDDDEKVRSKYEELEQAWKDLEEAKNRYYFLRKLLVGK